MSERSKRAPIVRFYRMIEQIRPPQRADRSALGTLPTRAYRYCDAITSAAAFGWYVFSPMDLRLIWDGADLFWRYDSAAKWIALQPSAQFPGQARRFDAAAPEELRGCSPPFLSALPEPGMVQIWTGLIARSTPDWSLLVRAPANLPNPGGYSVYEGIVESDRWFGPLFVTLRLTRTGVPVRFAPDFPLVQVQPLPRMAYAEETLGASEFIPELDFFDAADWADYRSTIACPSADPDRPLGAYAVASRKRRRSCPHHRNAFPYSASAEKRSGEENRNDSRTILAVGRTG